MRNFLPLLLVVFVGCQEPVAEPIPPAPIFIPPSKDENKIEVDVPANVVESIYRYAGAKNTITASFPWTISLPGINVALPQGTSISYDLSTTGGQIIFNEPKPKVTLNVRGIPLHPTLDKVVLKAPSTATVHAREFGQRTIDIDLDPAGKHCVGLGDLADGLPPVLGPPEPEPKPAPKLVPIIYFWSAPNCIPCKAADDAFTKHEKDAPFVVRKNPDFRPAELPTDRPFFYWTIKGKVHTQTGWTTYDAFLKRFETSRDGRKAKIATMLAYLGPTVGVRGMTVEYHLIAHHGFHPTELVGLTQDQLFRIHSACHKDD